MSALNIRGQVAFGAHSEDRIQQVKLDEATDVKSE